MSLSLLIEYKIKDTYLSAHLLLYQYFHPLILMQYPELECDILNAKDCNQIQNKQRVTEISETLALALFVVPPGYEPELF